MSENSYTEFLNEFEVLKYSNLDISGAEGNKRKYLSKNRYLRVVPYDFNRVLLGEAKSYVNASFIEVL